MIEERPGETADTETSFSAQVAAQAARKLKAKRSATKSIWFGLGMSGLIGWSVTIPALMGIFAGIWLDQHTPSQYSWTLMLMLMGLIVGCMNAWHWIDSEYKDMQEDPDE